MLLFISFVVLILGYGAVWPKKSILLGGSLALFSLALLLSEGVVKQEALLPLATLAVCFFSLRSSIQGLGRFLLVCLSFLLSGAVFLHLLPGFPSCLTFSSVQANYGKVLIGELLLLWLIPTLDSKSAWQKALKSDLFLSLLGAGFLVCGSLYLSAIPYAPTFSFPLLLTFLSSLALTIIPEEALLRGFLQREMQHFLGKEFRGKASSVLMSSALFCLFHLSWMDNLPLLGLFFVEGLLYGTIYEITDHIESAIACRFLMNIFYTLLSGMPAPLL